MDYTNDHLRKNRRYYTLNDGTTRPDHTPRLKCADGYEVSIQASEYHYCTPRETDEPWYSRVELGYPSQHDPLLDEFCEDPDKPTDTVYGYVPVEVVNALIEKHGGPAPEPA